MPTQLDMGANLNDSNAACYARIPGRNVADGDTVYSPIESGQDALKGGLGTRFTVHTQDAEAMTRLLGFYAVTPVTPGS